MNDEAQTDSEQDSAKIDVWDEGVRGKQRHFVLYYCTDDECFLNGTRAYRKAFPKVEADETAAVNACRLLRTAKVKQAVKKLLRLARDESDEEAVYRLIRKYETLAFYDPARIINADGSLKVNDLAELGPLSQCISGIETRPSKFGVYTVVKLANTRDYMQDFAKYLNLIRPENQSAINVPVFLMSEKTAWSDSGGGGAANGNSEPDSPDNPDD